LSEVARPVRRPRAPEGVAVPPDVCLYYPHFEVRDENWAKEALLYWETIATIVPLDVDTASFSSQLYRDCELGEDEHLHSLVPSEQDLKVPPAPERLERDPSGTIWSPSSSSQLSRRTSCGSLPGSPRTDTTLALIGR